MDSSQSSQERLKVIAAIAWASRGDEAAQLFSFASVQEEAFLNQEVQKLEQISVDEVLKDLQRKRRQRNVVSHLESIHAGWIVRALEGESPRLLSVLCRTLSGDKVRELMDALPHDVRTHLPSVNETYRVPQLIVTKVRELVERKIFQGTFPSHTGAFGFSHLLIFKVDDLKVLFRDLGLEEIRKAFSDVDPHVLKSFISRFSPVEAREIRKRIESGIGVPKEKKWQAQKHIVMLNLEGLKKEDLFEEIGFAVFASSLLPQDESWIPHLYMKMNPKEGSRLQRFIQEKGRSPVKGSAREELQKDILYRIKILSDEGKIAKYWRH